MDGLERRGGIDTHERYVLTLMNRLCRRQAYQDRFGETEKGALQMGAL